MREEKDKQEFHDFLDPENFNREKMEFFQYFEMLDEKLTQEEIKRYNLEKLGRSQYRPTDVDVELSMKYGYPLPKVMQRMLDAEWDDNEGITTVECDQCGKRRPCIQSFDPFVIEGMLEDTEGREEEYYCKVCYDNRRNDI